VSNSYRESATQRNGDSRVFIDLDLFWEIIEASAVGELPQTGDAYFGPSLTSYRQPHHSEEVLRTRLLPEPTRLGSDANRIPGSAGATPCLQLTNLGPDPQYNGTGYLPSMTNEASILAQNYFALGEDLVGNLDDWWYPRPSA
jgi:hypothetical protein